MPSNWPGQSGEGVSTDHQPHVRDGDVPESKLKAGIGQGCVESVKSEYKGRWPYRDERMIAESI